MEQQKIVKIVRETVRSVFREELRDIILECLKTNNSTHSDSKTGETTPDPLFRVRTNTPQTKKLDPVLEESLRNRYREQIEVTQPVNRFNPRPVSTAAEGTSLPEGEVSLDQIMNLVNVKNG